MINLKYAPSTVKADQHTNSTSIAFVDTKGVRFTEDGRLRTGETYALTSKEISGNCRAIYGQRITTGQVGNYTFFGTHTHLYVEKGGEIFNITPFASSSVAIANSLDCTDTDETVNVNHASHGLSSGDRVKISGSTDFGGFTAATHINKEHIITVTGPDDYTFEAAIPATSTVSAGGGASTVVYKPIAAGRATQVTASGMGAGDYGGGLFGAGGESVTGLQIPPRIWSFAPFGNKILMCPGDIEAGDGQKIYVWDGDTTEAPTVLTNAPTDCNWVTVVNNAVVALCERTIKISEIGAETVWSGLLYYEKTLERVELAFSCFEYRGKTGVIHHKGGAILLRYVGGGAIWDLEDLYSSDAAIAPYSCTEVRGVMFWQGARGIYAYDGGYVTPLENPYNGDWINKNILQAIVTHSFAAADEANGEAYFWFPIQGDAEPAQCLILNPTKGTFTLDKAIQRTAAQRPGYFNSAYYFADGNDIYRHFTTGAPTHEWHAETSLFMAKSGTRRMILDEFRNDANQNGNYTLEIWGREYAQGNDVLLGAYTITPTTTLIRTRAAAKFIKFKFKGNVGITLGNVYINYREMGQR
jgi:hypothetical protein